MSDRRIQLDKAMDDIKEEMIKDIINFSIKLDNKDLIDKNTEFFETSN